MPADQPHTLLRQTFEVTVQETLDPYQIQDRLSSIQRNRLEAALGEVLDEFTADDQAYLVFDRLQIDIGELAVDDLETDLVDRVREALREALQGQLYRELPTAAREEAFERSSQVNKELEALRHFLLSGTLPWWIKPGSDSIEGMFTRLLTGAPQEVSKLIRDIGRKDFVRKRIVRQFSDALLHQLVHVLEPSEAEFILAYAAHLQQQHEQEPLVREDREGFRQAKWELILTYLLVDRGSEFNRKSFLQSVIVGLARMYTIAYVDLLRYLEAAIQTRSIGYSLRGSLPALIRELWDEWEAEEGGGESTSSEEEDSEMQDATPEAHLAYWLRTGALPGGSTSLDKRTWAKAWHTWLQTSAGLRETREHLKRDPNRLRQWMQHVPHRLWPHLWKPALGGMESTLRAHWEILEQAFEAASLPLLPSTKRETLYEEVRLRVAIQVGASKTPVKEQLRKELIRSFRSVQQVTDTEWNWITHELAQQAKGAAPRWLIGKRKPGTVPAADLPWQKEVMSWFAHWVGKRPKKKSIDTKAEAIALRKALQRASAQRTWSYQEALAYLAAQALSKQYDPVVREAYIAFLAQESRKREKAKRQEVASSGSEEEQSWWHLLLYLETGELPSGPLPEEQLRKWAKRFLPKPSRNVRESLIRIGLSQVVWRRLAVWLRDEDPDTWTKWVRKLGEAYIPVSPTERDEEHALMRLLIQLGSGTMVFREPAENEQFSTWVVSHLSGSAQERKAWFERFAHEPAAWERLYTALDRSVFDQVVRAFQQQGKWAQRQWQWIGLAHYLQSGEAAPWESGIRSQQLRERWEELRQAKGSKLRAAVARFLFEQPAAERLAELLPADRASKLYQSLLGALPEAGSIPKKAARTTRTYELDLVLHYIRTGSIPWWAYEETETTVWERFRTNRIWSIPGWREAIRSLMRRDRAARVAAHRLPDEVFRTLVRALDTAAGQPISLLYRTWEEALTRARSAGMVIPTQTLFLLRSQVVTDLVHRPVIRISDAQLTDWIQSVAVKLGFTAEVWAAHLQFTGETTGAFSSHERTRLRNWVEPLLGLSKPVGEPKLEGSTSAPEEDTASSEESKVHVPLHQHPDKRYWVEQFWCTGRPVSDTPAYSTSEYVLALADLLSTGNQRVRSWLRDPFVQQQVTAALPERTRWQWIRQWAPEQAEYWQAQFGSLRDFVAMRWGSDRAGMLETAFFAAFLDQLAAPQQARWTESNDVLTWFVRWITQSGLATTLSWLDEATEFWGRTHSGPQTKAWAEAVKEASRDLADRLREEEVELARLLEAEAETEAEEEADEEEELEEGGDPIFVDHAGIILLWPFFSTLFERCELTRAGNFRNAKAAYRAVHLLHYLATAEEGAPEHELTLMKRLCGVTATKPIEKNIQLTNEEKDWCTQLIEAAITQWSILKNTSVEGFRESFLKRSGKLEERDTEYLLRVEQRTFDMLLDHIPWSINVVRLRWMQKPIYVTWR